MDYIENDIYQCVVSGDTKRLRAFLVKGLNPNHVFRCTDFSDRLGQTLLEVAILNKQADVAKILVEGGCNPNLTYVVDISPAGHIIRQYNKPDRLKLSVMFGSIVRNDMETLRLLVRGGFNVNVHDDRGCSALWHAVDLGNYEMVKCLLDARDSDVNLPDKTQLRPLHIAAIHGSPRILSLLIRCGAHVDALQLTGSTPLCLAGRKGDFDCVRYLLLNGANPNHVGCNGHTPLSSALQGRASHKVVQILIDAGSKVTLESIRLCQKENPIWYKEFPDLRHSFEELASLPQTLAMLCSLRIRRCLMLSLSKEDFIRKSNHLSLPKSLREYVILSHL